MAQGRDPEAAALLPEKKTFINFQPNAEKVSSQEVEGYFFRTGGMNG